MKNILALGAHPDDIEYGCGGTLIKEAERGNNVYLFIATKGERGGVSAEVRTKEQEGAAKILGAKNIFWGGFKDTQVPINGELVDAIDKVVKEVKPDEVYVNYYKDSHQDHRALAQGVIAAARYVRKVLFYDDFTSLNFQPDIFVDITDLLNKKNEVIKAHESQVFESGPVGDSIIESVDASARYRGFQAKVKYAEGFKALRFLKD